MSGLYRRLTTNIYQTRDGRYYHCHGENFSYSYLTLLPYASNALRN